MNGNFIVRPGDLITAELWNELAAHLSNLESRIAFLEQAGGTSNELVIDTLIFTSPLRVGSPVTVLGKNFGGPGRIQVVFDDQTTLRTQALEFAIQSDTRVVFNVPSLPGLSEGGRNSRLKITNIDTTKSDFRDVQVLPRLVELQGNATVRWSSITPNPFAANNRALFGARVTLETSRGGTFVLTPQLSIPAWRGFVEVLDDQQRPLPRVAGSPTPSWELTAATGRDVLNVFVALSVPASASAESLTLSLGIAAGSVSDSSETLSATVGLPVALPGADVTVVVRGLEAEVTGARREGNTIFVPVGVRVTIRMELSNFRAPGTYLVGLTPTASTLNWGARLVEVPQAGGTDLQGHFDITAAEVSSRATRSCGIVVQPATAASATGSLDFNVQLQGSTAGSHHIFELIRI